MVKNVMQIVVGVIWVVNMHRETKVLISVSEIYAAQART